MALRLTTDIVVGLRRLGFETVDDLMRAPRSQLALRFGSELGQRLDHVTGALFEPIDPVLEPEAIWRRVAFVEPIKIGRAHV